MIWQLVNVHCLTLTWDVFKFCVLSALEVIESCLTLTWDVFKYTSRGLKKNLTVSLTLTWDVFKSLLYLNLTQ